MFQFSNYIPDIALLISVVSIGLNIDSRTRDKYKLRFFPSMITEFGDNLASSYQIGVDVTNEGRRPISIVEIYYEDDENERSPAIRTPIYGETPPKRNSFELAENQTRSFSSKKISHNKMRSGTKKLIIGVVDSRGKTHTMIIENEAYED